LYPAGQLAPRFRCRRVRLAAPRCPQGIVSRRPVGAAFL